MVEMMSIRLRANLIFVAIVMPALLIAAFSMERASSAAAHRTAMREAALLTAEAGVVAEYITDRVVPLASSDDRAPLIFVPATTPFYAVREEADAVAKRIPTDSLRRVVLDPVGNADRPDDWERGIINHLRSEKDPKPFTIERSQAGAVRLSLITPLPFSRGVCATCYSSRRDAPPGILDVYGGNPGFDRQPGEIVGITIATVPLAGEAVFWTDCISLVLVALASWCALNGVLQLLVLRPLGRVAAVAEQVSLGQAVAEFEPGRADEIGKITRAFNRLRRSMESAIMLVDP